MSLLIAGTGKLDLANPNADDFELWSPSEGRDERCLFGRQVCLALSDYSVIVVQRAQTMYYRRIRDRQCYIGEKLPDHHASVRTCQCTEEDYEWYVLAALVVRTYRVDGAQRVQLSPRQLGQMRSCRGRRTASERANMRLRTDVLARAHKYAQDSLLFLQRRPRPRSRPATPLPGFGSPWLPLLAHDPPATDRDDGALRMLVEKKERRWKDTTR